MFLFSLLKRLLWPSPTDRDKMLVGDGSFEFQIVGESHYQDALETLCGGRTDASADFVCLATVAEEPTNPYDRNAVQVMIDGKPVGHLARDVASDYRNALRRAGFRGRALPCMAKIVGGWERRRGDRGHFGVKLDLEWPPRVG